MFNMLINTQETLDKSKIQSLSYPGLTPEVHGNICVPAIITVRGKVLFDVCSVVSQINRYDVPTAIRPSVIKCLSGSGYGSGTILIFRRGGAFADTQAMSIIIRRFFGAGTDTSALRKVANTAFWHVVKNAPEAPDMSKASLDARVSIENAVEIYPNTLKVSKKGIFGRPTVPSPLAKLDAAVKRAEEQQTSNAASPKEPEQTVSDLPTPEKKEDELVLDAGSAVKTLTDIAGISTLLQALLKGQKLSVNITVKID